ncbi:MAG: PIN domain-containing protein [Piscinibacter sp.]|uniref:type II toxin-antitoxin system VapC family toxin n=1 Tax=Piscinibacter sp. TaxID=1903157 RepID=UPI002586222E|nr:PIN domain-containing protein [Piscinibacter sp.]MCW5664040.1 PIN domain-containing protein [Piscinibacter sp.]
MAEKRRVYWDACIWFAVIKQEAGRFARANHVLELARRGDVEIWTSSLTLAEVFRKQCGDPGARHASLTEEQDKPFEEFIAQDFVVEVQLDHGIAVAARRLLRKHPRLKKPQDAVHLATAADCDVDEFHTFDGVNLLPLNGDIFTKAGKALKICNPPEPPRDLFTDADEAAQKTEAPRDLMAAAVAAKAPSESASPASPTPTAINAGGAGSIAGPSSIKVQSGTAENVVPASTVAAPAAQGPTIAQLSEPSSPRGSALADAGQAPAVSPGQDGASAPPDSPRQTGGTAGGIASP